LKNYERGAISKQKWFCVFLYVSAHFGSSASSLTSSLNEQAQRKEKPIFWKSFSKTTFFQV